MKKNALLLSLMLASIAGISQIAVTNALVPQYCQGVQPTNNNRVPCWFWVELTGLTPGATYRYYTTMDTLNASPTSNGAGVPMLINSLSGTIRRTTNPGLTNSTGHDSLVASNTGTYSGWFGVDASGNGRYTPGNTLFPKFIFNNGAGGTSVATRLLLSSYPVSVINFGNNNSTTEGTALYDSLDAVSKNFICLYDDVALSGRPVSIAIVENDGCDLYSVTSTAAFYRNNVDTLNGRWGTIIPNVLANGIRSLEERDFTTGLPIDTMIDADGYWCYGVNTANMTGGNTGIYLNSTFILSVSAIIPDTAYTGSAANFSANSNSPYATYVWNYGDISLPDTGAATSHTYTTNGMVQVTVVINTGGCIDSVTHFVNVLLGTGIPISGNDLWFNYYPNPADEIINFSTRTSGTKVVTLYTALGYPVLVDKVQGNKFTLDVGNIDPGIYLVEVYDETTARKGVHRILIQ